MRLLKFEGKRSKDLLDFITNLFEDTNAVLTNIGDKRIGFVVGEKYFLRRSATVSCSILYLQNSPHTCEIYIIGAGGASMFDTDLGARDDLEEMIAGYILEHALDNLGLKSTEYEKPGKSYTIFEHHHPSDKQ